MQITITEKGIKPEDVFKILPLEFKYIAMNSDGMWGCLRTRPIIKWYKNRIGQYKVCWIKGEGDPLFIDIDYSGLAQDSLFCRGGDA